MEPIGSAVRRELGRFGPAAGMSELVEIWPRVVGEAIARNAWPARVSRDGTLHVATGSAVWAFELAQLEGQLLAKLRAAAADAAPKRLRFAVGRVPEPVPGAAPEAEDRRGGAPSADDRAAASRLTAEIAADELRDAVAEAVAHSLARGRSSRGL